MKRALDLVCGEIWVMLESRLTQVLSIAQHEPIDIEALEAARGEALRNTRTVTVRDGVATIPFVGPMFRYANLFTRISGATSIDVAAQDYHRALNDDDVKAIILSMDSPGGTVNGTNELAKMIRRGRGKKPTVAYVSGMSASGNYWVASAADRIVADETALLGSIGVVATVIDERDPRSFEFVSSQSPNKRPDLRTDAGRAVIQARVDAIFEVFAGQVAINRGVDAETVRRDFGQGDVMLGRQAVRVGMADAIGSYEEVLAGLAAGALPERARPLTASSDRPPLAAAPPAVVPSPSSAPAAAPHIDLDPETRRAATIAAAWAADANLRAEFGGDVAVYRAFIDGVCRGRVHWPLPEALAAALAEIP